MTRIYRKAFVCPENCECFTQLGQIKRIQMELALDITVTYIPAECQSIELYEKGICPSGQCPPTCFCMYKDGKEKLEQVKIQWGNKSLL
jgi:hypothetical protein